MGKSQIQNKAHKKDIESLSRKAADCLQKKDYQAAQLHMRKALKHAPKNPHLHNMMGLVWHAKGKHKQALDSYDKALSLDGVFQEALFNKANLFLALEQYDQALSCYDLILAGPQECHLKALIGKANALLKKKNIQTGLALSDAILQYDPRNAEAHNLKGLGLFKAHKFQEALESFNTAIALNSHLAEAYENRATLYVQMGKFDEAVQDSNAALRVNPMSTLSLSYLTAMHKFQRKDSVFDMIDKAYQDKESLPPRDQARLCYLQGRYYKDLKEYNRSFSCLVEGGKHIGEVLPFDQDKHEAMFEGLRSLFPQSFSWPATKAIDGFVPIFIVGLPRSGSTLLETMLGEHQDIACAGELPFLLRNIGDLSQYDQIQSDYESTRCLLEEKAKNYVESVRDMGINAPYAVDKMPYNFMGIPFIHLMFPNAVIVHIRRHPLDTLLSCFIRMFEEGNEWTHSTKTLASYYKDYSALVEYWQDVMPEGSFLDMRYEDLVTNPERELRRILDCADLPWDDNCLQFHKTERIIQTASAYQARQPLHHGAIGKWKRYEKQLLPLRNMIEPAVSEYEESLSLEN